MSGTRVHKIQIVHDCLQMIVFCIVIRALSGHIPSSIVSSARLNMPQIAREAQPPLHEAEVKNLDFHS